MVLSPHRPLWYIVGLRKVCFQLRSFLQRSRFKSYWWGTHIQTDRQTGDLISLISFLESRLKISMSFLQLIAGRQLVFAFIRRYVMTSHMACSRAAARLQGERLVTVGTMQQVVRYWWDDTKTRSAEACETRWWSLSAIAGDKMVRQRASVFARILQLVDTLTDWHFDSTLRLPQRSLQPVNIPAASQ
jgi:hypothetical protein